MYKDIGRERNADAAAADTCFLSATRLVSSDFETVRTVNVNSFDRLQCDEMTFRKVIANDFSVYFESIEACLRGLVRGSRGPNPEARVQIL